MPVQYFKFGDPPTKWKLRRHVAHDRSCGGWCDPGTRELYLSADVTNDKLFHYALHEALHLSFWNLSETTIERSSAQIALLLWTCGSAYNTYRLGWPSRRWQVYWWDPQDATEEHWHDFRKREIHLMDDVRGVELFRRLFHEGIHAALPFIDEEYVKMAVEQTTPLIEFLEVVPKRANKARVLHSVCRDITSECDRDYGK